MLIFHTLVFLREGSTRRTGNGGAGQGDTGTLWEKKEAPWGLLSSQLPAALALTGTGVQKLSYFWHSMLPAGLTQETKLHAVGLPHPFCGTSGFYCNDRLQGSQH